MESLTEEQHRRIEHNRRVAIEKCRERRRKTVEKENRESFGDSSSGIDWDAAVCEMERVTRSHPSVSALPSPVVEANPSSSAISNAAVDARKRKIQYQTEQQQQQQQHLTDEQRLRMENNRKKALEKKQQRNDIINNNSSNFECSALSNEEQRAWLEKNRRKALDKKQPIVQQCTSTSAMNHPSVIMYNEQHNARNTTQVKMVHESNNQDLSSTNHAQSHLTQEQLFRVEENRRRALEKKNQTQAVTISSLSSSQIRSNQDLKHQDSIVSNFPEKAPAVALTEEQRMRMEQNRQKALQKKHSSSPSKTSRVILNGGSSTTNRAHEDLLSTKKPPASTKKSGLPPLRPELQYHPSRILPICDDVTVKLIENADLDKPLLNGWTLYDHQKEGVLRALRMRRLILAFDMGLGKTIIGCVWARTFLRTFEGIKVFVIAPVSLHEDWKRTAIHATGLKLDSGMKKMKNDIATKEEATSDEYFATGKKRKSKKKKKDALPDDDDDDEPNVYLYSWNNVAAYKEVIDDCQEGYVVICDEAHNMQSMSSQRTKDALELMSPEYCHGVLLLSGTPMKNGRPSNLFPLLQAVRHPFGDLQERYEAFFCDGQRRDMGSNRGLVWVATGSNNLRELNAHTASHIFRMTKEECMSKELPPRKRELRAVPVCPLHQQRYNHALKDLAKAFTSSQGDYGSHDSEENILTPFNKLRQISSFAKVDAVVSIANTILVEESSIVVFTSFVDVAKQIHQKLEGMDWTGELLTGETVTKKRQSMVDKFQSGLSPVFVCTYGAGGVGLTLTAACTVILVDRPWTPGDVSQAEDRVRRIGQKRPVRSIWIRAFPIDEQIDSLIDHKDVTSKTAVDGKPSTGQSRSAPKVKISELIKSVIYTI